MQTFFSKKDLGRWGSFVLLPLVVGALIYRFLRDKKPRLFGAVPAVHLPKFAFLLHSLPSLLWSFALTSALLLAWQPITYVERKGLLAVAVATSVLFEVAQAADFMPGTFDWRDTAFSLAGCLVASLIFKKLNHANHA